MKSWTFLYCRIADMMDAFMTVDEIWSIGSVQGNGSISLWSSGESPVFFFRNGLMAGEMLN